MTFFKQTVRDVPLDGQIVLVRADYNVPLKEGAIGDDLRIKAGIPTLQYLLDRGCTVVLISHLGRPEGKDPASSLEPVGHRIAELLGRPVLFVNDCKGERVNQVVKRAAKGSIILLENLRYYPEEEADDREFARAIAISSSARYFVQDGFGVVHRAHASTHAITEFLPSVAGLLLEKEYVTITTAMKSPERPLVAVMGGAKVSDKIQVVQECIKVADTIIIGGAMANTVLAYRGVNVGSSKVEEGQAETVTAIYEAAQTKVGDAVDEFIVLPRDVVVAKAVENEPRRVVTVDQISPDEIALDIGDRTADAIDVIIDGAKTVIWNGPLGMTELESFRVGSARLAAKLASRPDITSIVGGGDTADFVLDWDNKKGGSFSHVSTGGGASLELMAGQKLPGVESLLDAPR